MTFTQSKAWTQSLTILSSLGTVILGIATLCHVAIAPEYVSIANQVGAGLVAVITGVLAIIGRIRATKTIGPSSTSTPALLLGLTLIALLVGLAGCQPTMPATNAPTPLDRLVIAEQSYSAVVGLLDDAEKRHLVDKAFHDRVSPLLHAAHDAIAVAHAHQGNEDFDTVVAQAEAAVGDLQPSAAQARKAGAVAPAASPAGG